MSILSKELEGDIHTVQPAVIQGNDHLLVEQTAVGRDDHFQLSVTGIAYGADDIGIEQRLSQYVKHYAAGQPIFSHLIDNLLEKGKRYRKRFSLRHGRGAEFAPEVTGIADFDVEQSNLRHRHDVSPLTGVRS